VIEIECGLVFFSKSGISDGIAGLTASLRCTQVVHPDNTLIRSGRMWLEPVKGNDVVVYEPQPSNEEVSQVPVRPGGNALWNADGLASAETYSAIFQVYAESRHRLSCSFALRLP
jgi:hypothetical protein